MLNRKLELTKKGWSNGLDAAKPENITRTAVALMDGCIFWKRSMQLNTADEACDVTILILPPIRFVHLSR